MVVFNYEDTFTGSVEKLQDAFSDLGVSASSSVAAIAQAMKAMIGMSGEYTSSLADAYSVIGGNGYSHAEGAQSKACGDNSYAIGWQNVGITVNDNDRNTIFSIHTDLRFKSNLNILIYMEQLEHTFFQKSTINK